MEGLGAILAHPLCHFVFVVLQQVLKKVLVICILGSQIHLLIDKPREQIFVSKLSDFEYHRRSETVLCVDVGTPCSQPRNAGLIVFYS